MLALSSPQRKKFSKEKKRKTEILNRNKSICRSAKDALLMTKERLDLDFKLIRFQKSPTKR